MRLSKGIITAYDATNHKADVLLVGSMSRVVLKVPVAYQVAPEQVAQGTMCGVVFFGEGDAGLVMCTFDEVPVPPLDLDGYGPPLTVSDLLRGWRDDFLGDGLDGRYTPDAGGAGTVALWGSVGGGWVRCANDAGAGTSSKLWLGDNADGYATLDVAIGWTQICIMRFNSLSDIEVNFGVSDAAGNNVIRAGYNDGVSANWEIVLQSGGGGYQHAVSSAAAQAAPSSSTHALRATNLGGGVYQLDYWLDGALILSIDSGSYAIPTGTLTPLLYVRNRTAVQKIAWWNWWVVVPT